MFYNSIKRFIVYVRNIIKKRINYIKDYKNSLELQWLIENYLKEKEKQIIKEHIK